tara:strand:+ start:694 stop:963 length:270 start_codon:yes stop_codon:yes gene_type:complete
MLDIKPLGANRLILKAGDLEILYSYVTPVAAKLSNGDIVRSKTYIKGSTSPTTEKHITQTYNKEWSYDPKEWKIVRQSYIEGLLKEKKV